MIKKIILWLIVSFIAINLSYWNNNPTIEINQAAPLVGFTSKDKNIYAWKIIFPIENWVKINASELISNPNANIKISWNFYISAIKSWATFNIWTVSWVKNADFKNIWWNKFKLEWYAWSDKSWWIDFWVNYNSDSVIYDRTIQKVNWCWFSQSLWKICFDNLGLDTTPPDINSEIYKSLRKPFSATNSKQITFPAEIKAVIVDNYNNLNTKIYDSNTITHNFQTAKFYNFEIVDTYWNKAKFKIQVVAWLPDISNSNLTNTFNIEKTANWIDKHNINFKLLDAFWNIVKNESIYVDNTKIWEKNVSVETIIDNSTKVNQINETDTNNLIKNPIRINDIRTLPVNIYNPTWNYNIDITSTAPTNAWYTNSKWDILLKEISYNITTNWVTWVWESNKTNIIVNNNKLKFLPTYTNNITNDNTFRFRRDLETTFNIITHEKTNNFADLKLEHRFNTVIWSNQEANNLMSFQDITWWECYWYQKQIWLYSSTSWCNVETTKNYSMTITSWTSQKNIKATPKIVARSSDKFHMKYESIISYTDNNSNDIKYKWIELITDENTWLNQEVKIIGIANWNNIFSVNEDSSNNFIWKINKSDILTNIRKNAQWYINTWSVWDVLVKKDNDYILNSWPNDKNIIIVYWKDLIIGGNIEKESWKLKVIIALKDKDNNWWNIYIKDNVTNINSIIVTDRSIISWDKNIFYTDNSSLNKNQLYIKWSVISHNTIWWASDIEWFKCPFYITNSCDYTKSKRYDLNLFRNYINEGVRWIKSDWIDSQYPFIIEYDPEIVNNPPKILTNY